MDKNAIKKYAVWARRELIERVTQRALFYGVTATEKADLAAASVNGRLLSDTEKAQRQALIAQVDNHGFDQTIEEVAYTWFNRFAALRFMEVNNYLPTHTRVFTNDAGEFKPQLLTEAIHIDLDGLDPDRVYELKSADKDEELYRYLLITQCNALNKILPGMFQKIADYTELLLPDHLLRTSSVIEQMVTLIPEQDWQDQVQIIGWLYQYYNSEPKDEVFARLKKNVKVAKDSIPAATQLFTPDWIVRYMVENSLGRLWLAGHPNDALQAKWHYYVPDAPQEAAVTTELDMLKTDYARLQPQDLSLIDCCSGSGHILAYAFDVLMDIYTAQSYKPREAVRSILEHNLYGLDIDERAWQLTYFSLMMKARQYDRRLFSRDLRPQVCAIEESNGLTKWNDMKGQVQAEQMTLEDQFFNLADYLIDTFQDAKNYGSLLKVEPADYDALLDYIQQLVDEGGDNLFLGSWLQQVAEQMPKLIRQAKLLSRKYWVCITNPPYLGSSNFNTTLNKFAKNCFPDSKSDLFAMFIERGNAFIRPNGFQAMITQHSWMFLSSFEKLRAKIQMKIIVNMAHLGPQAFEEIGGEVVQTTSFILCNSCIRNYKGEYYRLIKPTTQQGKEDMFLRGENCFKSTQLSFSKIPGSPVAYWVNEKMLGIFTRGIPLKHVAIPRKGLGTGNKDLFMREWWEPSSINICFDAKNRDEALKSKKRWFPHNKGGEFRKWYGNDEYVVNWYSDGEAIKTYRNAQLQLASRPQNQECYFKECITWSKISSGNLAFRFKPIGNIFNEVAPAFFTNRTTMFRLEAFLNSAVCKQIATIISPTLDFQVGQVASYPIFSEVLSKKNEKFVEENTYLSQCDWDSFENSWNFIRQPLVRPVTTIQEAFSQWQMECDNRFNQLKSNEEKLNQIFINIYGLEDELTPEEEDKDVTVRKSDISRDIRAFISYAVGCMFGRYSLDTPGLAYAGGSMLLMTS